MGNGNSYDYKHVRNRSGDGILGCYSLYNIQQNHNKHFLITYTTKCISVICVILLQ